MHDLGIDGAIAYLAERQHGVVAAVQLLAIGVTRDAITWRLATHRLHRVYRGVYAVGHRKLTWFGRLTAAVLATGPGTAVSHRTAGSLRGMRPTSSPLIELTRPSGRSRSGYRLYRSPLPSDEYSFVQGVPVTGVARTSLDLAATLDRSAITRALERSEALRLTDTVRLDSLLDRYPTRAGTRVIRAILAEGLREGRITRSELERRFATFLDGTDLPEPQWNVSITVRGERMELDCLWRKQRLVVELDGFETHGTRAAFERDRRRDRLISLLGLRPVRLTWLMLRDEPEALRRDLAELLAARRVL